MLGPWISLGIAIVLKTILSGISIATLDFCLFVFICIKYLYPSFTFSPCVSFKLT